MIQEWLDIIWLKPVWVMERSIWLVPLWELFLGLTALCIAWFAFRFFLPKAAVIAQATAKEIVYQPLFYLMLIVGAFFLWVSSWLPYYTFGEDIKFLKDTGLTWIMVLSIFLGLWTAGTSIADEIEGRTAVTVLSKPISRIQFILGKLFGILAPIAVLFIVLGSLFLLLIPIYLLQGHGETPELPQQLNEMVQVIPGLVLAFMEVIVLVAISVAISTRLPMLANMIICASIYILGHLAPLIVEAGSDQFVVVGFIGQFIAVLLPNLDAFNINAAVATGAIVPADYLGWAFLYCLLYTAAMMFVALLLFEDRDLA
ncbi:ABC-type transport system involved in multi-copper enzyme maturation, permease component [Planctomycetales bacterium 10988]|nr:ABC-type transport system involved in multi-copper enzyme maturation, permease component [Planctomycetales bacterium 10988]